MPIKTFKEVLDDSFNQAPRVLQKTAEKPRKQKNAAQTRNLNSPDFFKNRRRIAGIALAASAAIGLGAVAASINVGPNTNSQTTASPDADSVAPTPDKTILAPNDYDVEIMGFETANSCVRRVYNVNDVTFVTRIRNIRHDAKVTGMAVALDTCTNEISGNVEEKGIDAATNTIKKRVNINAGSIKYGAQVISGEVELNTVSPGEELEKDGVLKIGCDNISVWDCPEGPKQAPKEAKLTAKDKNMLTSTIAWIALQNVQNKCAPADDLANRQELKALQDKQWTDKGIDGDLLGFQIVDDANNPFKKVPYYLKSIEPVTANKGAFTKAAAISEVFVNTEVTVNCEPKV